MNPLILFILVLSLMMGTLMTFTTTNWLLIWMGFEINTMAIIPFMIYKQHPRAVEASTKYFLTQATASAILLFAGTSNAWLTGQWELTEMMNQTTSTLITLALALKIGLAPMHFWFPEVLQGISLTTGIILATWQKLAPFAILLQLHQMLNPNLLTILGLTSILVGGWGGLNQTQLRKILAYSSIAHLGWMVSILHYMPNLTLLNLIIYMILTSSMFIMLIYINSTKIDSIAPFGMKTQLMTPILLTSLLSLGGLPPLTGFMPKWLILEELTKQKMMLTITIMALATLLSLFFYLRLCYMITLTISPNLTLSTSTWQTPTKSNFLLTTSTMMSIMLLPLTPMMMFTLL
uniref:NADH-ubiquinone oxidoreductase chain 2 n=1 Tax=Narcine brasiliensis TaxID=307038 RepID=A0A1W5JSJ9_9CHON|nr:NADH dehydrogenase subunit 2 [Narcine brasiliensis]AMB36419.1 NADH dehydrogenase subunit 2 [Narcine brasiliensis]